MKNLASHQLGTLSKIAGAALLALSVAAPAQSAPAAAKDPHTDIYMYKGADRDQKILEGARKEGTVVVYTSLNTKDSVPIKDAFEKKYGVPISLWRAGSEKVLNRSVTEARAGRYSPDVIETNGPEMEAIYREQLLSEFYSPHLKDLPAAAIPAHRHYAATRFNFFVLGYNTNLVKPEEVPNTLTDLLKPRWAGKIAIEAGDSDWFAAVVKSMGEKEGLEFFRKLADTRPQMRTGHTLIAELLSAGELPITPTSYNQNIERLVQKGAPVKWKALAPTFGRPNSIGVAKHAPHPYGAMLFTDFMLSPEGQELIKSRNRVPSSTAVASPLNNFPYKTIDPVIVLDEAQKWEKLWADLFHKGQAPKKESD